MCTHAYREEEPGGAFWKMKCSLTHQFFKMRCRRSIFRNVLCSLFSSNNTWWVPTGYLPSILPAWALVLVMPTALVVTLHITFWSPCSWKSTVLWAQSAKTNLHSILHYEVKDFHNLKEVSVQKMEAKHSHSKRHGIPMAPGTRIWIMLHTLKRLQETAKV
jgi:hypothetical protein